ncbi:hypothetical protein RV08_GL002010 [Enterococcus mundtii]|nr:hypothetical protein RV08_GL002010 [Enterococcus mundtii]
MIEITISEIIRGCFIQFLAGNQSGQTNLFCLLWFLLVGFVRIYSSEILFFREDVCYND